MWWLKKQIKEEISNSSKYEFFIGNHEKINEFLNSHESSTPYHYPEWQKLLKNTFNHSTINLFVLNVNNISAYLPVTVVNSIFFGKYFISIGFADTGGILSNSQEAADLLLENLEKYAKSSNPKLVELRNCNEIKSHYLINKKEKILSYIFLPENENALWKRFDPKLRNQIRKALKSNIMVSFEKEKILKDFHKVYSRNMRYLGTPHLSLKFFKNLIDIYKEKAEVIVLYKKNIPIGGAVGIYHNDTLEVPWASSRREYFQYCPNNLLYWELLKKSLNKCVKLFSFGRSNLNSTTYKFKKQWGTEDIMLSYSYLASLYDDKKDLSPKNLKYASAIYLWKKTPLFLTRVLGPIISKGIG